MSSDRLLAFVDCNIIIESLFAPTHPANAITLLAANRQIDLITCSLVIKDIENEILYRAAEANSFELVDVFDQLIKQTRLKAMPDPPIELVKETYTKYLGIMRHQADIPVLASAIELGPNLILSDNDEHFNQLVAERCGIPMFTSEQFLKGLMSGNLRERLGIKVGDK